MDRRVIVGILGLGIFAGLCLLINVVANNKIEVGYNKGYAPTQPIAFSHQLHAGKHKIDCKFCHVATEISRHATVPSLNICMNCHMSITPASEVGKAQVEKLREAFYNGEPIAWQKVNLLPDHVKFNHSAHILKGKECSTCHGAVETMEKVVQHETLSMGFCVNCHRKPENNAPVTCGTCHY